MGPLLIERLFGRRVEYAPYDRCELISVGSLLGKAALYKPRHFLNPSKWLSRDIAVWGSGMLSPYRHFGFCRLKCYAVRGALTQAALPAKNCMTGMALGDPGLLADRLVSKLGQGGKKFAVGLIPHRRDRNLPGLTELMDRRKDCRLINVFCHPDQVIREIAECDFIYSSSLHGLIVADSLGIPNRWFRGCDEIADRAFKFLDYYSLFGIKEVTPVPLTPELLSPPKVAAFASGYAREGLDRIKAALMRSFPDI